MAKVVSLGFRLVTAYDLTDTAKNPVVIEQVTEIAHDAGQDTEDIFYEDSIVPAWKIDGNLTGNITVKGDLENYVFPSYTTGTKTDQFFEKDHYYLLTFLRLDQRGTSKMVYCRWIGQLKERTQETLAAAQRNEKEIKLAISIFGSVSFVVDEPYDATASGTPGPIDATPQGDYDPLFCAVVADATKTIVAAETEVSATLINPA